MKIRSKMLLSYAVIITIFLAAGVTSVFMMRNLGSSLTSFYDNNFTVTVNAWSARRNMMATRAYLMQCMLETDQDVTLKYVVKARDTLDKVYDSIPVIRKAFTGDEELIEQLEEITEQAGQYTEDILVLAEQNENARAFGIAKEKYIPLLDQMAETLLEISAQADESANELVQKSHKGIAISVGIVLALILLCVAAAVVLAVKISRTITGPIDEIKEVAKDLSDGKLEASILYESQDELGSLADSVRTTMRNMKKYIQNLSLSMEKIAQGDLNIQPGDDFKGDFMVLRDNMLKLAESLNEMLTKINRSAEQVSGGAEQVSLGAQSLSRGAGEQASSAEEMVNIFNEISENINENARHTAEARTTISDMGTQIGDCSRQMQDMVEAINQISSKSDEIGKVIKIIEDIAFQTNILALNAAVEAARSGLSGKGFMAVADEVRSLASKSQEASKNTAKLINQALETVRSGRNIAYTAADTMHQIVEGTDKAVNSINLIANATQSQAASVNQAARKIEDISDIIQTNSATAEESAAASEELSAQAGILKEMVNGFKLNEI